MADDQEEEFYLLLLCMQNIGSRVWTDLRSVVTIHYVDMQIDLVINHCHVIGLHSLG